MIATIYAWFWCIFWRRNRTLYANLRIYDELKNSQQKLSKIALHEKLTFCGWFILERHFSRTFWCCLQIEKTQILFRVMIQNAFLVFFQNKSKTMFGIIMKIHYINCIEMLNILFVIIFLSKIDSFWVISVSKAWRSERAGSFHIATIWVKTNTFCSMDHISKMLSFRDTKFFRKHHMGENPLSWLRFARNECCQGINDARTILSDIHKLWVHIN